jgi:ABC-type dipeptide/oligopeptide/nickel transport system permease component
MSAGMLRFLGRRVLLSIPVVLGVTVLVFLLIHLVPGNPARTALGPRATPAAVHALEHQWGLDRSLPSQYWLFLRHIVTGNLGTSTTYHQAIGPLVTQRLPVTLWLIVYGTLLSCVIGVPLAVLAARRPGGAVDGVVRLASVAALGMPSFWLGILLVEWLGVRWGVFPASGYGSGFFGHVQSMFLPSLTMALAVSPLLVRALRAEMLKVVTADYVVTARAKGLAPGRITRRHVLRNALVPGVTVLAVNIGFFVGATIVIEKIYALPGLGDLMLQGIATRDFQIVQSVTLVLAIVVIAVNLLGDLVNGWLDPRVEVT